jgi:transcriptional regulator with XRE-family HTH domain
MKRIWLRDARQRAKLTQAELAERIGKPQSYISKLENGQAAEPTFSDVIAISRALDVQPERLKFGQPESGAAA